MLRGVWLCLAAMAFALNVVLLVSRAGAQQEIQTQRREVARLTQELHTLHHSRRTGGGSAPSLRQRPPPAHERLAVRATAEGSAVPRRAAPIPEPRASARAQLLVGGRTRITVLSEALLRLEQREENEPFDDRASFTVVNRRTKVPDFSADVGRCALLTHASRCLVVSTALLRLEYAPPASNGTGEACRRLPSGVTECALESAPFTSATLRVEFRLTPDGQKSAWWPQKPNPRQLEGTVRTLDMVQGAHTLVCDKLPMAARSGADDQHCAMGVISREGWALIDDTLSARFDGARARGGWDWAVPSTAAELTPPGVSADADPRCGQWAAAGECGRNLAFMAPRCATACARAAARQAPSRRGGRADWYLFARGLDFKRALSDFAAVAGAQPVPPRYAFGIWFSRWWPLSDWESSALVREFEDHGVPLDVLVTDMDWHPTCYRRTFGSDAEKSMDASNNWPCWSGFTWDRKYFPHPEAFLGWCKARGVHNALNLHFQSGLQKEEERFEQFRTALGLPNDAKYAAFDPLNQTYSREFHRVVLAPLEAAGVDLWWLDWQQGEHLFAGSDTPEVNPTWWLNYVYYTQPDGRDGDEAPQVSTRRRLILHRWGGLGNHRYPIGFSGDVMASWESLAFQPYFTASAANVNFGYWSHDIGGFYEGASGELYTRWVQFGVFSPIFRAHGFRRADIVKRFWHFDPQYFTAMRSALRLRLEWLPHLYTSARLAHDGEPAVVRPLYYEWPTLEEAFTYSSQFIFGTSDVVVAPVTKPTSADAPLARSIPLWVPPGEWVQLHSGATVRGPASLLQAFALDEIPILVRAGSVLFGAPTADVEWPHCTDGTSGWAGRAQRVPRCVQVGVWVPVRAVGEASAAVRRGEGALYDDDGWSNAYLTEEGVSWRRASWEIRDGPEGMASEGRQELELVVHPASGSLTSKGEPGQPSAGPTTDVSARGSPLRSWRVLVHGVPPPVDMQLCAPSGNASAISTAARASEACAAQALPFAEPAASERWRRGDQKIAHWSFDSQRLCVVIWLFDTKFHERVTLRLYFAGAGQSLQGDGAHERRGAFDRGQTRLYPESGILGAMRRAQSAKMLLDATYPDTQPQDYDQVTWLAGIGSRLSVAPTNFSLEVAALQLLLKEAIEQVSKEPAKRASNPLNVQRVRNASALLTEIFALVDPSNGTAHQMLRSEDTKNQGDLTPRG
ncbi:hypothetical protein AB1Y20_005444 [Prymnesium parvum]|uniref:Alpha-glucosidase n=1 Tax=Prymnesium parvum TaxID=97485 RepID=A0AB34J469_PRYPA